MRMESGSPPEDHPDNRSLTTSEPSLQQSHEAQLGPACIPSSVRGAPEALKPAIRKKQNKESARRSRRRRKQQVIHLAESIEMLVKKTQELECRLESAEQFLIKSGYQVFPTKRFKYPDPALRLNKPGSESGPSNSGSIVLGGSDPGPSSRGASASRDASLSNPHILPDRPISELNEEEVDQLIAKCLGQL